MPVCMITGTAPRSLPATSHQIPLMVRRVPQGGMRRGGTGKTPTGSARRGMRHLARTGPAVGTVLQPLNGGVQIGLGVEDVFQPGDGEDVSNSVFQSGRDHGDATRGGLAMRLG